jgi:hypothetical protein
MSKSWKSKELIKTILLSMAIALLLILNIVAQGQVVKALTKDEAIQLNLLWQEAFYAKCRAEAGKQPNEDLARQGQYLRDICPKANDAFVNCKSLSGDGSELIGLIGDACRLVSKANK